MFYFTLPISQNLPSFIKRLEPSISLGQFRLTLSSSEGNPCTKWLVTWVLRQRMLVFTLKQQSTRSSERLVTTYKIKRPQKATIDNFATITSTLI
jgi:hypothetical protein